MSEPRARRETGQAAVEAAMVMPLMVFLTLGTIQLTMMQHAKLMTEYAAYQACRAGIVWNGNNERMHDAAIVALLPTIGDTHNLFEAGKTWAVAALYEKALSKLMLGKVGGVIPDTINGSNILGIVRVDTISPAWFDPVGSFWKIRDSNWKELDFDGPDGYPEVPGLEQKIAKFFNLRVPDDQEDRFRRATVLTIRVRYWYQMRIPFANWIIFTSWFAANGGVTLHGAIDRGTVSPKANMMNRKGNVLPLVAAAKGISHQKGYPTAHRLEMVALWLLATGQVPLVSDLVGRRYFIPISATYSMRMQSNFNYKWIMHLNPDWGL